jgi:hypothetical protein
MLPQKLNLDMMQVQWAQQLNPVIANPVLNNVILKNVSLVSGTNIINHRLGRVLQGWRTTRVRASTSLYDTQDTNQTPTLTLVLVASAPTVIDLEVF